MLRQGANKRRAVFGDESKGLAVEFWIEEEESNAEEQTSSAVPYAGNHPT